MEAVDDDSSLELSEEQVSELLSEVRHQTILHWNYRRLTALPKEVLRECSHIHQIYLKRNRLTYLPDTLGCLSQLTYCYLHGNSLQSLPDSIGELKSLQVLDVGNNKIKHLPTSLGKLPSLRSLVAVYNQITCFPKELCSIKTLSILMLSGNNMLHLPEVIGGLTGLQGLYIDHNHLKELPRSLTTLPLLTRISCCCNALTHLPATNFISKPTVFFDDNPQVNYLPFSLMQQLRTGESWDPVVLQTCGCFQETVIVDNSVFINVKGPARSDDPKCLVLPPQINKINISPLEVTASSLLELCLRYIWKEKHKTVGGDSSMKKNASVKFSNLSLKLIPANLYSLLHTGPVAYCNYLRCKSPIFTFSSIIVIKVDVTTRIGVRGNIVPSILYFCSDSCNNKFVQDAKTFKDDFSLWLQKQLEQACRVQFV